MHTAEQLHYYEPPVYELVQDPVLVVPELALDEWSRARAARLIASAGSLAITETLPDRPITSLTEAVRMAAEGDKQAENNVIANVWTDVIERTYKAGHVVRGHLDVLEDGTLGRDGQSLDQVQLNTLRYAAGTPVMRERATAEARNSARMQDAYKAGLLEDYWFVVISRTPEDAEMSRAEKVEIGFFVETESFAIQATTVQDGKVVLEAAFVSGIKNPGEERHDAETIVALAASYDVGYAGLSPTQIIDTPLLIPKSLLPDGVINIVETCDDVAGGLFFGEKKPRQDYVSYLDVCERREAALKPTVDKIVGHLIAEASVFNEPLDAVRRLDKLSESYMVVRAVEDVEINPRVFGETAASHIIDARRYNTLGDNEQAAHSLEKAVSTAKSSSCPSAEKAAATSNSESVSEAENSKPEEGGTKVMTCPFCSAINIGDPCAKIMSCWDCHALVVDGKVKYEGNGGSKARKARSVPTPQKSDIISDRQASLPKKEETNKAA